MIKCINILYIKHIELTQLLLNNNYLFQLKITIQHTIGY